MAGTRSTATNSAPGSTGSNSAASSAGRRDSLTTAMTDDAAVIAPPSAANGEAAGSPSKAPNDPRSPAPAGVHPAAAAAGLGQPFIPSPLQPPRSQFASTSTGSPFTHSGPGSAASNVAGPSSGSPVVGTSSGGGPPAMVHFDPDADSDDEDDDEFDENGSPRKKRKLDAGGAASKKKDAAATGDRPRRKIDIAYIEKKEKRHISFSKRKAGIMKKAYELATLTGTEVLLLVVSETGIVFTFTTAKFQPMVALGKDGKPSEGQRLIQACLASDPENGKEYVSPPQDTETPLYPLPNSALAKPFEVHSNVHGGQIALRTRPPRSRKATSSPRPRRGGPPSAPPSPTKSTHGALSPPPSVMINDGTPGTSRTPQFIRRHPDEYVATTPGGTHIMPPDSPTHMNLPRPASAMQSARSYAEMIDRPPMHERVYVPAGHMYHHERRISGGSGAGGMPVDYGGYYRQPIEPTMYDQGDVYYEPGHYVLRNDPGMRSHPDMYQYDMSMPRSLATSYGLQGSSHLGGGPPPPPHHGHLHPQHPSQGGSHLHHSVGPGGPIAQGSLAAGGSGGGQRMMVAAAGGPGHHHHAIPAQHHGSPVGPSPGGGNGTTPNSANSMYDPQLTGGPESYVAIPPRDQN